MLVKGDAATALRERHCMVVSESMANKIFGDEDPMGQHIQMPNDGGGESERVITVSSKIFHPTHTCMPILWCRWNRGTREQYLAVMVRTGERIFPTRV